MKRETTFGLAHVCLMVYTLLSACAPSALADEIVFDNFTDLGGNCYFCTGPNSQDAFFFPFDSGVADDFILIPSADPSGKWKLTELSWSGAFPVGGGAPAPVGLFNIFIWPQDSTDPKPAGGTPTGGPDYAQAIFNLQDVPTLSVPNENGERFWDYSAVLPDGILLEPDVPYWLEIQAVIGFLPYWTWQPVLDTRGGIPHHGDSLLGVPFWTQNATSLDMSFTLYGEAAPEPSTAALLCLAIGTLLSRRRHGSSNGSGIDARRE